MFTKDLQVSRARGEDLEVHADVDYVLFTAEQIQQRVRAMGRHLCNFYKGKRPLYVCVLKGAFVFLADLVREMEESVEVDFMAISSYGNQTKSSGVVKIIKDLDVSVEGRDVILVEDIIDSGKTLQYLTELLERRGVASLRVVPLLVRPGYEGVWSSPENCGFVLPERAGFVVGYGLDYASRYRNLPYVGALNSKVFSI